MHDSGAFVILAGNTEAGKRFDQVVALHIPDCSRSFAAHLIRNAEVLIAGVAKKPGYRIKAGDVIRGQVPPPAPIDFGPEPIPLEILYEDEYLLVVNKQAGLVVHPSPGHSSGTLVNGLLQHCPDLKGVGGRLRPGIVHRLDKDTSGALVAAKCDFVHQSLAAQFKSREVKKTYLAMVYGEMARATGIADMPIGRHPVDRKKMSTISSRGRSAETRWRVKAKFNNASLLEMDLKTGRTHQIRVHCAAIGHPIIGDKVYGHNKAQKRFSENLAPAVKAITRQMLHAWRLRLVHPATKKEMLFEAPVPADMAQLIHRLKSVKCLKQRSYKCLKL